MPARKKSGYILQSRFYRLPFKSILRIQMKREYDVQFVYFCWVLFDFLGDKILSNWKVVELKTPPAGCVKAIALPVLLHDHYFKTSIFSAKRCCCIFFSFYFFFATGKRFWRSCAVLQAVLFWELEDIDFPNYSVVAKEKEPTPISWFCEKVSLLLAVCLCYHWMQAQSV